MFGAKYQFEKKKTSSVPPGGGDQKTMGGEVFRSGTVVRGGNSGA